MAKNFSNVIKDKNLYFLKSQQTLSRRNFRRSHQDTLESNYQKTENFKSFKKEVISHTRDIISLTANIASETMDDRRQWNDLSKVVKAKLSTKNSVSRKTILQK